MPGLGQRGRQGSGRGGRQGQLAQRRRRQVRHRPHQQLHVGAAHDVAGGRAEFLDVRHSRIPGADGDLVRGADGAHLQVIAHLAEPQLVDVDAGQEGDGVVIGIGGRFGNDIGAVAARKDISVVAEAAGEHVAAFAALQGIVAETAGQGIGQLVAGQYVVIAAAHHAGNIDQHIAAGAGRMGFVDGNDAGCRARLGTRIGGRAVRAGAAQHVAAGDIDVEYVVIAVARHRQAGGAHMHLFDVGGQRVVRAGIDGIAAAASLFHHHVTAVVDVIRVVAGQARHHVGAHRALDDVRVRRAGKDAIAGLVRSFRTPVLRQRRRQGGGRCRWQGQLASGRHRQARHCLHEVLHVAAQQHAAIGRAEFLDAGRRTGKPDVDGDLVAGADGAHFQRRAHLAEPQLVGADASQEGDDVMAGRLFPVNDDVGAVATGKNIRVVALQAGQGIVALAAAQDIVAKTAHEGVFELVTGQNIIELAAGDVGDIKQHVAAGRRRHRAIRSGQGRRHALAGRHVVDRVARAAAIDPVATGRINEKDVIGIGAARYRQAACGQAHVLDVVGHRVIDAGVDGIAAAVGQFNDHVAAVVDVIRVVAGQAFEHVGARGAAEDIRVRRAREALCGGCRTVQVSVDGGDAGARCIVFSHVAVSCR
ncbi:hypothetical protein D3C81_693920 [compost metagenome]